LPIILALAPTSIGQRWFKRTMQMVSCAPHVLSVVMVGIIFPFLSTTGNVNQVLGLFAVAPIAFMSRPGSWKSIHVWSGVGQNVGVRSIVSLAALSGIDPILHEAAILDGATRLQRMRDIDLTSILPVAFVLRILSMGSLRSTGSEKVILMQNPLNLGTSGVIDSRVYRAGLGTQSPRFAFAAAIGLLKAGIGRILPFAVNQLARRLNASSTW
jgi:multiple sugar transport system permease protein/putative aldouronate transport system permease protein